MHFSSDFDHFDQHTHSQIISLFQSLFPSFVFPNLILQETNREKFNQEYKKREDY